MEVPEGPFSPSPFPRRASDPDEDTRVGKVPGPALLWVDEDSLEEAELWPGAREESGDVSEGTEGEERGPGPS